MNIWSIRYILLCFGHFSCTCAEIAVGLYFCFHSEIIPTFSVALILVAGLKFSRFDNISVTLTVFSLRICRSSYLWTSGQTSHITIRGSDISATWEHLRLFFFQWISLKVRHISVAGLWSYILWVTCSTPLPCRPMNVVWVSDSPSLIMTYDVLH